MHFKSIVSVQRPAQRDGTISRLADRVRPRTSTPQPPETVQPYRHAPKAHFLLAFIIDNPLAESARKMILYKKSPKASARGCFILSSRGRRQHGRERSELSLDILYKMLITRCWINEA